MRCSSERTKLYKEADRAPQEILLDRDVFLDKPEEAESVGGFRLCLFRHSTGIKDREVILPVTRETQYIGPERKSLGFFSLWYWQRKKRWFGILTEIVLHNVGKEFHLRNWRTQVFTLCKSRSGLSAGILAALSGASVSESSWKLSMSL